MQINLIYLIPASIHLEKFIFRQQIKGAWDKIKKQFCLALCLRINGGSRKTKNYDVLPRVIAEAATLATRRSHQSLSASI
jgi:hypothetical protein